MSKKTNPNKQANKGFFKELAATVVPTGKHVKAFAWDKAVVPPEPTKAYATIHRAEKLAAASPAESNIKQEMSAHVAKRNGK